MATSNYRGVYAIKPWWQRRLSRFTEILIRWRVHPDTITAVGVVCAGLMGIALCAADGEHWLSFCIAPLAIARLAANALDGQVARRTGLARPWGEVFNEGCDRLADVLVFGGLAFNSQINAPLAWCVLILTLLSSYVGVVAKAAGGQRQFGGFLAKADRMMYMALFSFVAIGYGPASWNWLLWAFIPALLLTIVQRCHWTYRDLQRTPEELAR